MNPLVAALAGSGLVDLAASPPRKRARKPNRKRTLKVPVCDCDLDWEQARANAFGVVTGLARFSMRISDCVRGRSLSALRFRSRSRTRLRTLPHDRGEALAKNEEFEECLLHVQAVLRFVEDRGLRTVEDARRDLLAAVRGQAMQDDGVRAGARHELLVEHVARESLPARSRLLFLAHADPDVRRHRVGPLDGLGRGVDARPRGPVPLRRREAKRKT